MDESEIHANDVLFGRGGFTNNHNRCFRMFVESSARADCWSMPNIERRELALMMIQTVKKLVPSGRFLEKRGSLWFEVTDEEKIVHKVNVLIREATLGEVTTMNNNHEGRELPHDHGVNTSRQNDTEADAAEKKRKLVESTQMLEHCSHLPNCTEAGKVERAKGRDGGALSSVPKILDRYNETLTFDSVYLRETKSSIPNQLGMVQNSTNDNHDRPPGSCLIQATGHVASKEDKPRSVFDVFLELHEDIRCLKYRVSTLEQQNKELREKLVGNK